MKIEPSTSEKQRAFVSYRLIIMHPPGSIQNSGWKPRWLEELLFLAFPRPILKSDKLLYSRRQYAETVGN